MDRNKTLKKLTEVFKTVFDDENIVLNEETTPMDIECWDSLSQIGLINEIEKAFNVKFTMNEVFQVTSIKTIIDIIESKI